LILTALCTALPAQLGHGDHRRWKGALLIGALAATGRGAG